MAVPGQSSQPAQPLVTRNLWICCHCQVRICYSPSWESKPTVPPEGTPLSSNDPPGCETSWPGCGASVSQLPRCPAEGLTSPEGKALARSLMDFSDGWASSAEAAGSQISPWSKRGCAQLEVGPCPCAEAQCCCSGFRAPRGTEWRL